MPPKETISHDNRLYVKIQCCKTPLTRYLKYHFLLHKLLALERAGCGPGVELPLYHQPSATQHRPRSNECQKSCTWPHSLLRSIGISCNVIIDLPPLYDGLLRRRHLSLNVNNLNCLQRETKTRTIRWLQTRPPVTWPCALRLVILIRKSRGSQHNNISPRIPHRDKRTM